MAAGDHPPRQVRNTKDLLQAVAPVVGLAALVVYGVLTLAYSRFYRELGINPGDVGLETGAGLRGVAGVSIVLALAVTALGLIWLAAAHGREPTRRTVRVSVSLLTAAVLCWFTVTLVRSADQQADRVKEGRWLQPMEVLDLEVLGVRADPAYIRPISTNAVASEIADATGGHLLFYIGQASGTLILYDSTVQRVWHVPAALVSLQTENCETSYNETDRCRGVANSEP